MPMADDIAKKASSGVIPLPRMPSLVHNKVCFGLLSKSGTVVQPFRTHKKSRTLLAQSPVVCAPEGKPSAIILRLPLDSLAAHSPERLTRGALQELRPSTTVTITYTELIRVAFSRWGLRDKKVFFPLSHVQQTRDWACPSLPGCPLPPSFDRNAPLGT